MSRSGARYATLLVAVLAMASTGWGDSKPNLSGTWKLDPLRSRLGDHVDTKGLTLKIEHSDPALHITMIDPKNTSPATLDLTTDGAEHPATFQGQPATATASWDDGDLYVTVKQKTANGETEVTRRFRLGDKGKILTTVRTTKDPSGAEKKSYEFFVKE